MHDGEDAGFPVICHFLLLVIGQQPRHARIAGQERLDEIGMKHRVEFAFGQHDLDRFVIPHHRIFDVRCMVTPTSPSISATHSIDIQRHAVFMLQDAAHPQHRGGHHGS